MKEKLLTLFVASTAGKAQQSDGYALIAPKNATNHYLIKLTNPGRNSNKTNLNK